MGFGHKRRRMLLVFAAIGLLICLWLVGSFIVAHRLTHRSSACFPEPLPDLPWATLQSVQIQTADHLHLGAWYIPGLRQNPIVLLLHGNGGCRSQCLEQARILIDADCGVFMPSLRAHGDSDGETNDFGYSARRDVVASIEWIEAHFPDRRIIVWGQSLGSAAAVFASKELGDRIGGYILESPFENVRTAVRNRMRIYLPWPCDAVAYTGLMIVAPIVLPHLDAISPIDAIHDMSVETPVLILSGSSDKRATTAEARRLLERKHGLGELVIIEGGDHLQLQRANRDHYTRAIHRFIAMVRH